MRSPEKFEPQSEPEPELEPELEPQSEPEPELSPAKKRLEEIRKEVNEIADKKGRPIEEGIKETVVMFNAFDIKTWQSCEGHAEEDERSAPWVMFQPKIPENEEWCDDEESREKVIAEGEEMKKQIMDLLNDFYKKRKIEFGNMLGLKGIGYSLKLQSNEAEIFKGLDPDEAREKLLVYRKEMSDFTEFLKENYTDYASGKSKI